jgi:very-short-patch-repair endonuclease
VNAPPLARQPSCEIGSRSRHGYFVLRFLAEDVGKELEAVLDAIVRVLARHRHSATRAESLKFVRE